jgi:hypothetical protein
MRVFIMTTLRSLSFIILASTAIFSGLNCFENRVLKALKDKASIFAQPEPLLGTTFAGFGSALMVKGKALMPYSKIRGHLAHKPGTLMVLAGLGCIGNAINSKHGIIK